MATHQQVANAWANKTGRACKGHHMFHNGTTIYSYGYHFPIARHTIDAEGVPCILFTTRSYSVSTAKHITIVRRALNYGPVLYMQNPSVEPNAWDYGCLISQAKVSAEKARRARVNRPYHVREALRHWHNANELAQRFALDVTPVPIESLNIPNIDVMNVLMRAA